MSNPPTTASGIAHTPRSFEYALVDVFAERPLEGNALAIFTDARGLTTAEMQSLARETNLSETTFILPRAAEVERKRGIEVRIFTTREELNFAGHPTLGTASWLYLNRDKSKIGREIRLDLRIGPISVAFAEQQSAPGIYGTMTQNDPVFGEVHDPSTVAAALGLEPEDLDTSLPIQTVSTGKAFCIVPLRSLEITRRLAIPQASAQAYLSQSGATWFYCITRAQASSAVDWHARMQFYNGEDPATGSAAGCAIAYLVHHGAAVSGQPVVIEQGVEVLRPSRIYTQATLKAGRIRDVRVGGRTIPIASGRLFLP
ncbi:MAG TPA: PhzF family phenazine biosynthesis protein [Acidobacteriaceae bacterium]|nr:PhzF family phenazine biosynthesis protein [Acidobacteriaceae bacterium]